MNITLNTKELLNGLTKLSKVMSSKNTLPILNGVKLYTKDDKLTLTGGTGDVISIITIDIEETAQNGSVVLDFNSINTFVKKSKSDVITMVLDDNNVIVSNGKVNLKTTSYDGLEYPTLPQLEFDSLSLTNEEFINAITTTSYAASTSDSRPILKGINIRVQDNQIKFVATDSHRLGEYKVNTDLDIQYKEVTPIAIYLDKALKMIDKKNDTVNLKLNDQYTVLEFDNVELYIKNIEGNYPDTSRIIPYDFKTELEFNVSELLEILPQIQMLAKNERNGVMRLDYNSKDTVLSTSIIDNEMSATVQTSKEMGEYLKLAFSSKYFMDSLKSLNSDTVKIKFISAMRPFILQATDQAKHLILPVRTY